MSNYEIHIMTDEEFDRLPYKRTKEALGMADPETNKAYIRQTGVRHLDRHTIDHEFDELLQKVSPHEEDGIRYKIPIIPLLFKAVTAVAKPVLAAGKFLGGAALKGGSALARGAFTGAKALGSTTLKGAKALSGFGAGSSAAPGIATPAGASTVTIPGISASVPVGLAKGGSALAKFGLAAAKSTAVNKATGALQKKFLSPGISDNGVAGGGGQAGALSRFANPLANIGGDIGTAALSEGDVNEGFVNIDRNAEERRRNIFQLFRGQTPDKNSRFAGQLANINVGTQREKDTFLSEANKANDKRNLGLRRQEIQKINNLSDSQFDEFLELARGGSDSDIRAKVNQDPGEFRNVFKGFF